MTSDRVGLSWRWAMAAATLSDLVAIDTLEIVAEQCRHATRREVRALRALARERPVHIHSLSLGLASSLPVMRRRIDRLARLIDLIEPVGWSEHLAFVRAGDIEIGHLAPTPRTVATLEGSATNIALATRIIGAKPAMENIATLVDAPMSTLSEPEWTHRVLAAVDCPLLLDLHNLYANANNFGHDPQIMLDAMPLERVTVVHLSGGRRIEEPGQCGRSRVLDDHKHAVPDDVFALLASVAARVPEGLTVIIERDGEYPPFAHLLDEMARARTALRQGRAARLAAA